MRRFATRRQPSPASAISRSSRILRAARTTALSRRRLLLETLEDRRLLTGEMDITNVVPPGQVTAFEAPLAFSTYRNNEFSILAANADMRQVDATFTTTHGQISLLDIDHGQSPNFDHGDGSNDHTFTIRGTIDEVNMALQWLVFQPDPGYAGEASITVHTVDLIPFAGLEPSSDTDSISITVEPFDHWHDPPAWITDPGALDQRFHDTGKYTRDDIHINRFVKDEQGRLLAVGEKDQHIALARMHPDGTLDSSFGNAGIATLNDQGHGTDLVIQPDGQIVVVGTVDTNSSDSKMLVARYESNGSLDLSFATDGIFTYDWQENDSREQATAVGLHPNGKIVVTGSGMNPEGILVIQLEPNGQLDTLFDDDGHVGITLNHPSAASDLTVTDDGRILLGASTVENQFILQELDYRGHVASTLAIDMGTQVTVADMLTYPDGRILLAGQANNHFAMARFNANGSLDTSFGSQGKVYTLVGTNNSRIHRLTFQDDGSLLAVGQASNGTDLDFAVARYLPDGTLDHNFDEDGLLMIDLDDEDIARDIVIQDDASLLIVGGTGGTASNMVQLIGNTRPGEIQGTLFHDHNGNTNQDAGEPGLAGRIVFLDMNRNNQLDPGEPNKLTQADDPQTMTVETGNYHFTDLLPGDYSVQQVIPTDWISTYHPHEMASESFDSEATAQENGWTSNNPAPQVQVVGFSNTSQAGGTTGEGRAAWQGHPADQASYYGDTKLVRSVTVDDHLVASGKIRIQNPGGSLGDRGYLGFFNSNQDGPGGNSQDVTLVGLSFNENDWYLSLWNTTLGYQGGLGRVDSPATTIQADTELPFSLAYDPTGGDHGHGLLTGSLGGQSQQIHLTALQRAALQGTSFDAFGLYRPALNDGNYHQPGIDIYVDDLNYQYYETHDVFANEVTRDIDLGNQKPNQAPAWNVPADQVVDEETNLVIEGLSVSDPDAGDQPLRVMLSTLHGQLTLAQTTGLTFQSGDGVADTILTVTATATALNAAMDGLSYQGNKDYAGLDFLTAHVNDLGNRGDGEPLSSTGTLPITVRNINDAPVAVDDEYQVDENQQLQVIAPGVVLNDYDVDNDNLEVITRSEPGHGILTLSENGSVVYIPNFNFNKSDSFTYQLNDGNELSNIATVRVHINTQFAWHNSTNAADVNGDGMVTTLDALHVINSLNQTGSRELNTDRPLPLQPPFYDVNRDGRITPNDALMIINLLNEQVQAEGGDGEGEGEGGLNPLMILPNTVPTRIVAKQATPSFTPPLPVAGLLVTVAGETNAYQLRPSGSDRDRQPRHKEKPGEFSAEVDWLEVINEEILEEILPSP